MDGGGQAVAARGVHLGLGGRDDDACMMYSMVTLLFFLASRPQDRIDR